VRVLAIALAACLGSTPIFAQLQQAQPPVIEQGEASRTHTTTRSIIGTVFDKNGAPVPNAVVLLKDTKTLQVRSFIAQKDGSYHFYGLNSDINYELRAQANGFTSPSKLVSVFDGHQLVTLNLKLKKRMKS
jgi:hypothetical protein